MKNRTDCILHSLSFFSPAQLLGGLTLFLMFAVSTLTLPGCAGCKEWQYMPATKAEERSIYVVSHGWHTGVVLSRQDMVNYLGFLDQYLHEGPYYEFGWGEEDFYQTETNTVSLALKALFWKNKTVMHVAVIPDMPERHYNRNDIIELNVSKTGLDHLLKALLASFKLDQHNRPYPLGKGLYGESRFFKAEGYYLFTNTCNRWTATMLNKAGVPMDTVFTLRAKSVIRQAEEAKKCYPSH